MRIMNSSEFKMYNLRKISIICTICSLFLLIISNSIFAAAPVMNTSTIFPALIANDTQDLYGYCNATDSDASNLTYEFTWYRNGVKYITSPVYNNGSLGMGYRHSCAIRSNDSMIICWGENQHTSSQGAFVTGDGVLTSPQPNPVTSGDADRNRPAKKVTGGFNGGIMIDNNSFLVCWGYTGSTTSQCGNGFATSNLAATQIGNDKWIDVDMARTTSCAINATDYRVYCSGEGTTGEKGDGSGTDSLVFQATSDTNPYIRVSAGLDHFCGIMFNGSIKCWGQNSRGQLGDGSTSTRLDPTYISSTDLFMDVDSRAYTTCAIRANDSKVYCWGNNTWGQFGNGSTGTEYVTVPTLSFLGTAMKQVSVGFDFVCGLRLSDSKVECAGRNNVGQLATGNNLDSSTPQTITNSSTAFLEISAGAYHVCGIENYTRRVVCWGWNHGTSQGGGGQIGVGTNTTSNYTSAQYVNTTIPIAGVFPASKEVNISTRFLISNLLTKLGDNFTLGCTAYDTTTFSSEKNSTVTQITSESLTSCGILSSNYTLTNNVSINGSTCFTITDQNVTLDCNGYSIIGNNTLNTWGVYTDKFNTTVKNCRIEGFDVGIYYYGASN
jgi:alpha-tubulin suppressor-like RCC1 family protein